MMLKRWLAGACAALLLLGCTGCKKEKTPESTGLLDGKTENSVVAYEGTYQYARLLREDGQAMLQEQLERLYPGEYTVSILQEQRDCDGRIYFLYEIAGAADSWIAAVDEISGAQYRLDTEYEVIDKWSSLPFYDKDQDWHRWEGTYQSADGEILLIYRLVSENLEFEIVGGVYDYCYIFGSFAQTIYGEQKLVLSDDEQTLTLTGTHEKTYQKISESNEYRT